MKRAGGTAAVPYSWRRIIYFWLFTRIWLSVLAAFCSAQCPRSLLEQKIGIWPPGDPLTDWLARIVLAPWNRWDVEYFLKIAAQGYSATDGTLAFHPLFPLLGMGAGTVLGRDNLLGLFVIGNLCGLLFLLSLERLARLDLSGAEAQAAPFYFIHLPAGFIIFAPYTESLFLLCSVLAFLMARRGRWVWAGTAGALAALTRQQGILLIAPLAWELWEWSGRDWRKLAAGWRNMLALLLTPAGLILWLCYRAFALNDVAVDPLRPGSWIYGMVISRSAMLVVREQSFVLPWKAFALAVNHLDSADVVDLCGGGIYLLLLAIFWRRLWRLRPSYLIYTIIVIVVSFSLSTGLPHAYMGLPRHCLLAFPLILPLAIWGRRSVVRIPAVILGFAGLFAMTLFYVCKIVWVP